MSTDTAARPTSESAPFVPFDTTFGTGGTIAGIASTFVYTAELAGLSGGRFLLAGYRRTSPDQPLRLTVAVFTRDGAPDPSFGAGGIATVGDPPGVSTFPVIKVAEQADGRLLLGTSVTSGGVQRWSVLRLTATGTLDPSFSGDGRLQVSFPGDPESLLLAAIVCRTDGRTLVIGSRNKSLMSAAQYLPDGSLDRAFGEEGKLQVELPGSRAQLSDAVLDAAGNIVVVGTTLRADSRTDLLIARFRPDGTPDASFGFQGSTVVDFGTGSDLGSQLHEQPDGSLLVGGSAQVSTRGVEPALVRLLPDGSLDPTFGEGGRQVVTTGRPPETSVVTSLALLPDGRIALAGTYRVPVPRTGEPPAKPETFVAVRRPDGSADRSFDAGIGLVFLGSHQALSVSRMVAAEDKVVVLARDSLVRLNTSTQFAALRLGLGTDQPSAGPGPLRLFVTVVNDGDSAAGGVVRLHSSKPVTLVGSVNGGFTVDPNRIDVLGKIAALPPGGSATAELRTTVNGFEELITLEGSVNAGLPELDTADNHAVLSVTVDRNPTS